MTVSADGPAVPMMPSPPVSAGAAVSDDLGPVRTIARLGPACHGSPSQQDPPGHYPGPDGGRLSARANSTRATANGTDAADPAVSLSTVEFVYGDHLTVKVYNIGTKPVDDVLVRVRDGVVALKSALSDRAAAERAEIAVLEEYLPASLSTDELEAIVGAVFAANGFETKADMGKAMKAVNAEVACRADGRAVADLVKSRLS